MGYKRVHCELDGETIEIWLNWNDFKGLQLYNAKGDKEEELMEFTFYLALRHHYPDIPFDDIGDYVDKLPGENIRQKIRYMAGLIEELMGKDEASEEVTAPAKKLLGTTSKSLDSVLGSEEEKSGNTPQEKQAS